ncbi:MAG: ribosomal protein S18-alanine N-acetyltransferase [Beutenbergiaceae bacterium]
MKIRRLSSSDLDRVAQLEVELFGAGAWSREMLGEEVVAPGRHYLVAEVGSLVVGYAGGWLAPEGHIMTIAVDVTYQRRGIGRALLGVLMEKMAQVDAESVLLEVRADDLGAQKLYADFGFQQIGIRRRYYHGIDAVVMRAQLGRSE